MFSLSSRPNGRRRARAAPEVEIALSSSCGAPRAQIAQPLSLWGFAGNKYCRANYVPVSSREARGHFEIITSSSERLARLAASRNSTSDDTSFVDFIENMAIGQEIVAKPGSTKFAYVGRHEITHFRCFVAEVRAAMLPIRIPNA